eukprot:533414-Lingulodinium_polyedra.AAC.1
MGDAAQGLAQLCHDAEDPALACCPSVTLADQAKAFERIGHGWLSRILEGWGVPTWARNATCALVCGRTITAPLA